MKFQRSVLPATFAICLIIFAGFYFFVFEPTKSEILKAETETLKNRKEFEENEVFAKKIEKFPQYPDFVTGELDELKTYLPPEISSDKFTEKIYSAAANQKIRLISVKAGEVEKSGKFSDEKINLYARPVEIKFESGYVSAINFASEISDGDKLANLKNFSLTAANDSGKILSCEFEFEIYALNGSD